MDGRTVGGVNGIRRWGRSLGGDGWVIGRVVGISISFGLGWRKETQEKVDKD